MEWHGEYTLMICWGEASSTVQLIHQELQTFGRKSGGLVHKKHTRNRGTVARKLLELWNMFKQMDMWRALSLEINHQKKGINII